MRRNTKKKLTYSRRDFLKGFPLVLAGGAAIGLILGRLSTSILKRRQHGFAKGSIFTPAKKHHIDL